MCSNGGNPFKSPVTKGKTEVDIGKHLGQIAVVLICGFLTWFGVTVHSMSINLATMTQRVDSFIEHEKKMADNTSQRINSIEVVMQNHNDRFTNITSRLRILEKKVLDIDSE